MLVNREIIIHSTSLHLPIIIRCRFNLNMNATANGLNSKCVCNFYDMLLFYSGFPAFKPPGFQPDYASHSAS